MFVLQDHQVSAFRNAALQKFEDDMVEHVKAYFPNHYNYMQEENLRPVIRFAYQRAGNYELNTTRNVCLYLNSMLLLGSFFDEDPLYPWAKQMLTDKAKTPTERIDNVSDAMLDQLGKVTGSGNIFIYRAVLNLTKNTDEVYQQLLSVKSANATDYLGKLFRHKYEVLTDASLKEFVRKGRIAAAGYGISSEPGLAIYFAFMFMLGSGFDKDPQFPWIASILTEPNKTQTDEKMETLYKTTINHLKTALARYSH